MFLHSPPRAQDNYAPFSRRSEPDSQAEDNNSGNADAEGLAAVVEEDRNEGVKAILGGGQEEEDNDHCVICLHEIRDRTILPCAHDRLCFECIFVWCQQSRKCPLCNALIGPYLIHNFRSDYDYSKYYLPPLPSSPAPNNPLTRPSGTRVISGNREDTPWGRGRRDIQTFQERADQLELAISKRRWIYRHGLYAMHVASNSHTRYRPAPTPAQFAASQDMISRATIFIRRELRVWINLDVEFLTAFTLSLMKSIDIRSESAVKLLAEFLDMDVPYHIGEPNGPSRGRFPNAEHFAHELYSYLRSPFKNLTAYDRAVQYEVPPDIPPPPDNPLSNRHERHWEASSSRQAHADSSRRSARREESPHSHSSYLRFPREAYHFPSPSSSSSSDAYDSLHQYRYGLISRSMLRPSTSPTRMAHDENFRQYEYNNKDKKGKGRTTRTDRSRSWSRDRLRGDTWKSNKAEDASRTNAVFISSNKSSISSSELPRIGVGNSQKNPEANIEDVEEQTLTSISGCKPSSARDADEDALIINDDSSQSRAPNSTPADHLSDVPIHPNWGISIKGQAKLLGGEGGKTGKAEGLTNGTTFQARQRKSSELLHAHLLGISSTANRRAKAPLDVSSPSFPSATVSKAGGHGAEAFLNEANNSVSSKSGRDVADLDMTPQKSPLPDVIVSPSSSRMSARDIMARTRARLAEMRNDLPNINSERNGGNLPADIAPNPTPVAVSAAVRSYLLKQLEAERRKTRDNIHASNLQVLNLAASTTDVREVTSGIIGGERPSETPHTGEKQDPLSREEVLKAKLISRRADEKEINHK